MNKCKFFGHNWDWYNPHDRTCKRCKKHQIEFSEAMMVNLGYIKMFDYWETVNEK